MSNIEHKDVGVSSLKGTPSRKIYIKTSTESVYNPEGVTQEYINNHVDGSKIVDGTVTNSKIANSTISMGKLDNDVQTKIQQGTQRAWTPKGAYDAEAVYDVNDLVYHTDTNSSYISLQANNQGHNPAWQSATGGWWMKVVDGSYINVMVEELEQAIAQAIEDAQEDISGLISDSQATIDAAVSGANSAAQNANTAAANAEAKIDWVEEQVNSLTAYEVAPELDETSIIPVQNKVVTEAINNLSENLQDVESVVIDTTTLPALRGYPTASGVWKMGDKTGQGAYQVRHHKVLERTPSMKYIKIDALAGNMTRYVCVSDYVQPIVNDETPCNFCTGYESGVVNIEAGQSSGWVKIPDDCKYIIFITCNVGTAYPIGTVTIMQEDDDYDTSEMQELLTADYEQGGFDSQGQEYTFAQRFRVNCYYKVSKGDTIVIDYNTANGNNNNDQMVAYALYDDHKNFIGFSGWLYKRKYTIEQSGFVKPYGTMCKFDTNITPSQVHAKVYISNADKSLFADYTDEVATIARPPRVGSRTKTKMLTLLWFSDLHIDRTAEIQRIVNFKSKFAAYLDDVLNTGDTYDRGLESPIAPFTAISGHESILNVLGNHDTYASGQWVPTTNATQKGNVYNTIIGNYVSNWNVVQPANAAANKLMYWYKDYTDNTTYEDGTNFDFHPVPRNIRLIALDCMYWNAAENTWLQDVLADARTNNMSVVIACHYKPAYTPIDCNMSDAMQPSFDTGAIDANVDRGIVNSAAVTSVHNYINAGGKFICWLCGHDHKDYIGIDSTYEEQLVIGVGLAQCGVRNVYGVTERIEGSHNQDLFNIVGIDTYSKHLRILRVGADFDVFMRSKKSLCINYETKKIVSES